MVDAAVDVAADAIEHLDDRPDLDRQTRFLEHFPRYRLLQGLAHFHAAARQAPLSFERRVAALDQQHTRAVEDDAADTDHRPLRIRSHDDSPRTRRACTFRPRRLTFTSTECSSRLLPAGQ